MRLLLGAPVLARGRIFGNIYVTERRVPASLGEIWTGADGPGMVGANGTRGCLAVCHDQYMFARYFIELPIEPQEVERALTDAPANWLRRLAGEANHRGDTLLADVGFGVRVRVARQVAVELGAPVHAAGKTVLPIRWTPTGASGQFPALEADLEVAPLASNRTQLAMSARYVPPLGPIGHAIDRAVLYRVAEATLKDFLDRVGDALVLGTGSTIVERDVPAVAD